MTRTFTLASFRPSLFNVIGDQGNLDVLSAEIRWAGAKASVVEVSQENLVEADLVMFGSASRATMLAVEHELSSLAPLIRTRAELGLTTLFLGSSYQRFAVEIFGLDDSAGGYVSDYYRGEFELNPLVGYLNSDSGLATLVVEGGQIGSLLSGPLLAKNRWLLKLVAARLDLELNTPAEVVELQRLAAG